MIELAALARFSQLAGAVLLAGNFAFVLSIARPAARKVNQERQPGYLTFERRQIALARYYIGALCISALAVIWLQFLTARENSTLAVNLPAAFDFLSETHSGKVWLCRSALLILLVVQLFLLTKKSTERLSGSALIAGLCLSTLFLVSSAFAGHAAAAEGPTLALQVSIQAIHLLCSGIWLGGLLPLANLLWQCYQTGALATSIARTAVRRFSFAAVLCVLSLLGTGSFNAWTWIGGVPQLFGTTYGRLLLIKLALVLFLLTVGALNRRRLKPALLAEIPSAAAVILKLRRNVQIESILGMGILLIVAHMNVTPPAFHIQPDWPFGFRWNWSALEKAPKARSEANRGIIWAAVGAAALIAASIRPRGRLAATLIGVGAFAYGAIVIDRAISIDAYPTTYLRPAVAYQAIAVANGKLLYHNSGCDVCHGTNGYGDGPAASDLKPRPADLTAPHASAHTAGDLFWWLSHGVQSNSAMPGFSQSLSEEELWDLINYLRALANGERARALAPVADIEPWLVAPDFAYGTSDGASKTLKDHRGGKIVLLVLFDPAKSRARLAQLDNAMQNRGSEGLETILVPYSRTQQALAGELIAPVVTEGNQEIADTYKLFARSFDDEKTAAAMPHVEFLIDRQGYVRARWRPEENPAWADLDRLFKQIEALRTEKLGAPAPDDHVH